MDLRFAQDAAGHGGILVWRRLEDLEPLVQLRFPQARIPAQNCRTGHRAYNDYCFISFWVSFCAFSQMETCSSDSSFVMP